LSFLEKTNKALVCYQRFVLFLNPGYYSANLRGILPGIVFFTAGDLCKPLITKGLHAVGFSGAWGGLKNNKICNNIAGDGPYLIPETFSASRLNDAMGAGGRTRDRSKVQNQKGCE
jgi:hypothetical protein